MSNLVTLYPNTPNRSGQAMNQRITSRRQSSNDATEVNISDFPEEDRQVHLLVDAQTEAWGLVDEHAEYLLNRRDLERATAWSDRKDAHPAPNMEHLQFIEANARLKNKRLYRVVGIIAGLILAVILGRELAHLVVPLHDPALVSSTSGKKLR